MAETPETKAVSGDAPATAPESAPGNKQEVTGGQVEAAQTQQAPKSQGGLLQDLVKQREAKREAQEAASTYQAQLQAQEQRTQELQQQIEAMRQEINGAGVTADADAPAVGGQTQPDISSLVRKEIEAFAAQSNQLAQRQQAEQWLQSQSHFQQDPKGLEGLKDIFAADPQLAQMVDSYPQFAVEEANRRWCAQKGISLPQAADQAANSSSRASGVSPSTPGSASPKVWNRQELDAHMKAHPVGSPEWTKNLREVEKAHSEGRIK